MRKAQKREIAREKRAKFLENEKQIGLAALKKEQERREKEKATPRSKQK